MIDLVAPPRILRRSEADSLYKKIVLALHREKAKLWEFCRLAFFPKVAENIFGNVTAY